MIKRISLMVACLVATSSATVAEAAVIGDANWADGVYDYSSHIQNYAGTLMSGASEFWLTGPSDADADGNGYAWDAGDPDYVAGWRTTHAGEYVVVQWDLGIPDLTGDDLAVHLYAGPLASANVLASVDGGTYTRLGTIGGGTPGCLGDVTFDFAGLFDDDVHYVRVDRVTSGPNTGMFFDSFAGVVPEPATLTLLGCGAAMFLGRRSRRTRG